MHTVILELDDIRTAIVGEVAAELQIPAEQVDPEASFMRLGLTSLQSMRIVNRLRTELNMHIDPVALFEYETVEELAEFLVDDQQ